MSTPPRVVCAAMLMKNGSVILGVRHYSPDMRATLKELYGDSYKFLVDKQGFIDADGKFLTREEACIAAKANNQILKKHGPDDELFSEDLY